ncbi:MAG: hypothetical protein QQW96_02980 [Tychonema bourrellyi B0820]|nr:hypothetical protein [Tychonema bourrellyi B0820]
MGRRGDGETGRWGDGEMGRRGDGETGRWGDGETGRSREPQKDEFLSFSVIPPIPLLPLSFSPSPPSFDFFGENETALPTEAIADNQSDADVGG